MTADKKAHLDELSEKVLLGMRKAIKKLVETSAANNEELIVSDGHGNPKSVPAKELLITVRDY
jgi:hypothetical protein